METKSGFLWHNLKHSGQTASLPYPWQFLFGKFWFPVCSLYYMLYSTVLSNHSDSTKKKPEWGTFNFYLVDKLKKLLAHLIFHSLLHLDNSPFFGLTSFCFWEWQASECLSKYFFLSKLLTASLWTNKTFS